MQVPTARRLRSRDDERIPPRELMPLLDMPRPLHRGHAGREGAPGGERAHFTLRFIDGQPGATTPQARNLSATYATMGRHEPYSRAKRSSSTVCRRCR